MAVAPGSGYDSSTGIYHSKLPPVALPTEPCLGLAEHIFAKHAGRRHKAALIDGVTGWKLTYEQVEDRSRALAAGLVELGIQKGDVVLLLASNCVDYAVIVLAALLLGAVVSTANPSYTGPELDKILLHSGAKLVFSTAAIVGRLWSASAYLASLRTVLIGGAGNEEGKSKVGFLTLPELLRGNVGRLVLPEPVYQKDPALVLYSSGTTGLSKGVVITHRNVIASTTTYSENQLLGFTEEDVTTCLIPQFHVFGLAVIMLAGLARGATVVVLSSYSMEVLLRAVQQFRITHLPVVPPIFLQLGQQPPEVLSKYDLRSLRQIGCGGAPLRKSAIDRCVLRFPGVFFTQGYGMTETTGLGSATTEVDYRPEFFGAAGLLAINTEAKVVHLETKESLPPNHTGELWLRGPNIMKGYLNDEKSTAEALDSEGWLRTGDVVYFNEEGFLYVVDRIKELIKYKAFQVAPAELEALLLTHPHIQDTAVVPYPDDMAGEIPLAFIVRWPGTSLTEEDVKSYVADKVSSFKKVRKVIFVDKIPKSPAGKILRRELVQYALGTPQPMSKL